MSTELVIVIALALVWMPWLSPARAAVPGWDNTGAMLVAREGYTATLLPNGKVLMEGGRGLYDSFFSSAELYDPGTGTFTLTGAMGTARQSPTATMLANGKVLVAGGGYASGSLSSAELYAP